MFSAADGVYVKTPIYDGSLEMKLRLDNDPTADEVMQRRPRSDDKSVNEGIKRSSA